MSEYPDVVRESSTRQAFISHSTYEGLDALIIDVRRCHKGAAWFIMV